MKLSVSNIGWPVEKDETVYALMKDYGYCGLEIAPTRIFPKTPYDRLKKAGVWAEELKREYGLAISSMQSIWFGRQERLFGSKKERAALVEYTKKAIDFAAVIGCDNLVFGCPGNRAIPDDADPAIGVSFFKEMSDYAIKNDTVIGIEANPPIYNTNYINDTLAAIQLIEQVDSRGFRLNLDVGTMIKNREPIDILTGKVRYINHVHISEPGLRPIRKRTFHEELKEQLLAEGYRGYVSIELGKTDGLDDLNSAIKYVKETFG